jgi:hypothetical protein
MPIYDPYGRLIILPGVLQVGPFQGASAYGLNAGANYLWACSIPCDCFLTHWYQTFNVVAPNNGSNYWTVDIESLTTGAQLYIINTSGLGAGAWVGYDSGPIAVSLYGHKGLSFSIQKVGAPGTLYATLPTLTVQ